MYLGRPLFFLLSIISFYLNADPLIHADARQHSRLGQIDLDALEKQLGSTGISGWIHAGVAGRDQYVFTYRDPKDFFNFVDFPLVAEAPHVREALAKLKRHDEVRVTGKYVSNGAPIRHIKVAEITVVKEGPKPYPHVAEYEYEAKLPTELIGKSEFVGKIHAVIPDSKILVVEYRDAVIPVFTRDAEILRPLFRNDKVRVHYVIRPRPGAPIHLQLSPTVQQPIEVLDSMVKGHGQAVVYEGSLVLFPKSPQITRNVFALQKTDADGIVREYTLVNFEKPDVFFALLAKLQAKWDENTANIRNGRNKFVNDKIRVRAKGKLNVVDAGQANPQILIESVDDLTIL